MDDVVTSWAYTVSDQNWRCRRPQSEAMSYILTELFLLPSLTSFPTFCHSAIRLHFYCLLLLVVFPKVTLQCSQDQPYYVKCYGTSWNCTWNWY